MKHRSLGGAAWLVLCSLGCTSFPTIEAGVCGNIVLDEPKEACDTIVPKGLACRPPGDVAECQYDCRPKADGTQQACPTDYGCAKDGVCRIDHGEYNSEPVSISSEVASWLSTTDFDGDGRLDLVSAGPANLSQQSRFRLHYFDRDGELAEASSFPSATTRPVSRDLNGDGKQDLLFSTGRVGMVPGQPHREWLPASFSSYRIPNTSMRVLNVREDLVGLGTPLAAITKRGDKNGIFVPKYETARLEPTLELPQLVQDLVGAPLAANVFEGVGSPCDELVLGYRGTGRLLIVDLCEVVSDPSKPEVMWREAPLQQEVMLPPGNEVDSGALAADVNGDGHLDVIVGGSDGSRHSNFVALGDGQSLETLARPLEINLAAGLADYPGLDLSGMPLAAGDISGDGIADFVYPDVVLSSRPSLVSGDTTYFATYANRGERWTMAELGDLNANGFRDVVAAARDFPGITVINCSSAFQYVGVVLPTEGPVQFISTGDFDGDLIQDLAYVEGGKPGTENSDFLALAFGAALGPLSTARRIAAVGGVQQLGHGVDQGFDALFMVTDQRIRDQQVGALTLFEGNPERLPLAPYALVTFAADGRLDNSLALELVAGSFGRPGSNDVLALGEGEDPRLPSKDPDRFNYSLWLLPEIAGGALEPFKLEAALPDNAQPLLGQGVSKRLSVSGAAFDLDQDGLDEALWLMPEDDGDDCVLLVYSVDARADRGAARLRDSIHLGQRCLEPELRVARLDGERDALALLVGEPTKLMLLWNDGSGQLSLERSFVVPIPGSEPVRAFDLSPDLQRLAVVTSESLYVVDSQAPDPASSTLDHPRWEDVQLIARLRGGSGVAMLDPNLDEVPAIAVADADGIRLFEALLQ